MAPDIGQAIDGISTHEGSVIMSGISSIGNYTSDQYYQQLAKILSEEDAAKTAAATTATDTTDADASTESTATTDTTSLKDKIRTAIMAAVKEAENSGYSTDLLSIISEAVSSTLKDAGIDSATALNDSKVDASTKALLTALNEQTKVQSEAASALEILAADASSASSTSSNPLSLLSSLSGTNLSGYLFDSTQ
jgi:hypothetical protein